MFVAVKVIGMFLYISFSQAHQIVFHDFSPAPPNYEKSGKSHLILLLYIHVLSLF